MADNFTFTPGSGGTMAAKDDSGAFKQRIVPTFAKTGGTFPDVGDSEPFPIKPQATATGGCSIYRNLDTKATTGNNVKASAGTLYGIIVSNAAVTVRYLKIYDKASAPTSSDTPVMTIPLAISLANEPIPIPDVGISFSTGIGVRASTGFADNDNVDPTANDVILNLLYK